MEETRKQDPRHIARALALQTLFAEFESSNRIDIELLLDELEADGYDKELYSAIVEGVASKQPIIDPAIVALAPAWPLDQIAPVDLILLRMGIWEAFISKSNPHKVVINEIIELAKEFGGESSGPFVNGVLGNLLNNIDLQNELNQ